MKPCNGVFSALLDEGRLSAGWLTPAVLLVHKCGKRGNRVRYRPVSLTPIMLKTFEKVHRDRIVNHIEANNIMVIRKHRFWQKRSCATDLINFLEEVAGKIDRGERAEVCVRNF